MNKQISLLAATLFILFSANAQRVYFCDNYTANGEPIGSNTKVSCPAEGGFIYFLYQNGAVKLSQGSYYIYVDKLSANDCLPFDVKMVTADPASNWFVYDYNFLTPGDYRVSIKNPAMAEMTKEYLTLVPEQAASSFQTDVFDDPESMFYYTYSTFEATTSVNTSTGVTGGSFEIFNIDPELGGRIFFKVDNPVKGLSTESLNVFIDKKDGSGVAQTYDSKTYTIQNQNFTWASFYFDFFTAGEFTITVYSESMVFINSITITIQLKV